MIEETVRKLLRLKGFQYITEEDDVIEFLYPNSISYPNIIGDDIQSWQDHKKHSSSYIKNHATFNQSTDADRSSYIISISKN